MHRPSRVYHRPSCAAVISRQLCCELIASAIVNTCLQARPRAPLCLQFRERKMRRPVNNNQGAGRQPFEQRFAGAKGRALPAKTLEAP
jgi:hypothetical protein